MSCIGTNAAVSRGDIAPFPVVDDDDDDDANGDPVRLGDESGDDDDDDDDDGNADLFSSVLPGETVRAGEEGHLGAYKPDAMTSSWNDTNADIHSSRK